MFSLSLRIAAQMASAGVGPRDPCPVSIQRRQFAFPLSATAFVFHNDNIVAHLLGCHGRFVEVCGEQGCLVGHVVIAISPPLESSAEKVVDVVPNGVFRRLLPADRLGYCSVQFRSGFDFNHWDAPLRCDR